jgi:protease-4
MPTLSFGSGGDGDTIVEHIERADADGSVEALIVRLNTTGGEMSPSEDILAAIREFDGPTFAYIDDWCASAGYWIAVGCDEVWAHYGSMVGSIGVQFSQVRAPELADRIGLEYEDVSSGKYKNALGGTLPIMEMEDHERELLQTVSDGHYDRFVEMVAEERDLDEQVVRDTDGAFYRGERCVDLGLVDEVGTRQEFERALARKLGTDEVEVERFDADGGVLSMVGGNAQATATAFGTGVTTAILSALGFGSKPR